MILKSAGAGHALEIHEREVGSMRSFIAVMTRATSRLGAMEGRTAALRKPWSAQRDGPRSRRAAALDDGPPSGQEAWSERTGAMASCRSLRCGRKAGGGG